MKNAERPSRPLGWVDYFALAEPELDFEDLGGTSPGIGLRAHTLLLHRWSVLADKELEGMNRSELTLCDTHGSMGS